MRAARRPGPIERPGEDVIVLVDEDGTPIGCAEKLVSHHADTPLHVGFSVRYGDDRHSNCGDRGVSEWTIGGTRVTGETVGVRGCDLFELPDRRISRKDAFWKIVD